MGPGERRLLRLPAGGGEEGRPAALPGVVQAARPWRDRARAQAAGRVPGLPGARPARRRPALPGAAAARRGGGAHPGAPREPLDRRAHPRRGQALRAGGLRRGHADGRRARARGAAGRAPGLRPRGAGPLRRRRRGVPQGPGGDAERRDRPQQARHLLPAAQERRHGAPRVRPRAPDRPGLRRGLEQHRHPRAGGQALQAGGARLQEGDRDEARPRHTLEEPRQRLPRARPGARGLRGLPGGVPPRPHRPREPGAGHPRRRHRRGHPELLPRQAPRRERADGVRDRVPAAREGGGLPRLGPRRAPTRTSARSWRTRASRRSRRTSSRIRSPSSGNNGRKHTRRKR